MARCREYFLKGNFRKELPNVSSPNGSMLQKDHKQSRDSGYQFRFGGSIFSATIWYLFDNESESQMLSSFSQLKRKLILELPQRLKEKIQVKC